MPCRRLLFWQSLASAVLCASLVDAFAAADTAIRVSDINPGAGSSHPILPLIVFNGKLYFRATEPVAGQELYAYDGVNPPTLVQDLRPGAPSSSPNYFAIYNGQLHFTAADAAGVRQIWRYDGVNPPAVATPLGAASDPGYLKVLGTRLAFYATSAAFGAELWQWDGVNPISQVADIRVGPLSSLLPPFAVMGSRLLFAARPGGSGYMLWQWDGVNPPSALPGPDDSIVDLEYQFVVLNGVAVYANSGALWRWDGVNPPATVGSFNVQGGFGLYNGAAYFTGLNAEPGQETDNEIWRYDGVNPPARVAPGMVWGPAGDFVAFNGFLYFLAFPPGTFAGDVWKYDGVNPPIIDPNAWPGGSEAPGGGFTPFNGFLFLSAGTSDFGTELWRITSSGGPGGPAPTVTGITPTSGPAAGGTAVQIGGNGFVTGASATIGGAAATGESVSTPTTIAATTPALPPGTLNAVSVNNPDAQNGTLTAGWFADFLDVGQADPFHGFVEKLIRNGVTAGCGAGNYCRNASVTRAQMAVFLLKAKLGAAYLPPACTGTVFDDVACTGGIFDPWIEDLAGRGITGGCGGDNYCPGNPVTRAQMAVFLLKALEGSVYTPPACSGSVFDDVPCTAGPFDPWIEELASRAITGGCSASPPLYCPGNPNTRGQMAVFLVKTFDLQ